MIKNLYSVRDRVAEEFGPVFEALNDGVAIRHYRRIVANDGIDEDEFELWCVGTWHSSRGEITSTAVRQVFMEKKPKKS